MENVVPNYKVRSLVYLREVGTDLARMFDPKNAYDLLVECGQAINCVLRNRDIPTRDKRNILKGLRNYQSQAQESLLSFGSTFG